MIVNVAVRGCHNRLAEYTAVSACGAAKLTDCPCVVAITPRGVAIALVAVSAWIQPPHFAILGVVERRHTRNLAFVKIAEYVVSDWTFQRTHGAVVNPETVATHPHCPYVNLHDAALRRSAAASAYSVKAIHERLA